jgi:hypothetical protein
MVVQELEGIRRTYRGPGGVGCSAGESAVVLDDKGIDMSDKALRMLKHMRKQIVGQPARYVAVRGAAISIGVNPGQSECHVLVDELLHAGYLQRYPSPSLTAHGLYRLTDSGISAAEEADSPTPLREAPRDQRPAGP